MHPLFQYKRGLLMYAGAWLPLGAILGELTATAGHLGVMETALLVSPVTLVLAIACLSPWYSCKALPLRSTRPHTLLWQHLAASIVVAGGTMLTARLTAMLLNHQLPGIENGLHAAAPVLTAMVMMDYLLSIALHYVVIEAKNSRRSELLAREAQLKALKAQVNPHFLFNSLNSISALTAIDAGRARSMCVRLADFLRVSLRLGERESIPFAEEMELTRMYLDVEQVRFGERLRVTEKVDPVLADCRIPSLLVQPLVENAVKHGIALIDEGGEIAVEARVQDGQMRFTIENPFDPNAPSTRSGIGLANVRQRLEARYGKAAQMEVETMPGRYRVTLMLPIRRNA